MSTLDVVTSRGRGLDRATLRRLSRRSDLRGAVQLAVHLSILTMTGGLILSTRGGLWVCPAIFLHGIVLNFLFCPLHETVHGTAFASRRFNVAVSWLCGPALLLPPNFFRLFHFAHHRGTQDPALDPELAQGPPRSLATYLWRVSGGPNWKRRVTVTLRHVAGRVSEPFVPPSMRRDIVREARLMCALYATVLIASICSHSTAALFLWLLPLLAGQPFLRLFLMAEHAGCPQTDDAFANTRTTYTNGFVRLLTWQMSFHCEHHCFPSVPFHLLADVNALIHDRIRTTATGYLAVHRGLLRGFRR